MAGKGQFKLLAELLRAVKPLFIEWQDSGQQD